MEDKALNELVNSSVRPHDQYENGVEINDTNNGIRSIGNTMHTNYVMLNNYMDALDNTTSYGRYKEEDDMFDHMEVFKQ